MHAESAQCKGTMSASISCIMFENVENSSLEKPTKSTACTSHDDLPIEVACLHAYSTAEISVTNQTYPEMHAHLSLFRRACNTHDGSEEREEVVLKCKAPRHGCSHCTRQSGMVLKIRTACGTHDHSLGCLLLVNDYQRTKDILAGAPKPTSAL
jgi:hypothetical protein